MKRPMNRIEKAYVNAAVEQGCIICGSAAEWHHLPYSRSCNSHCVGFPVCADHHRGEAFPGQSIHSSRLLFEHKHGTEFELLQKTMLRVFSHSLTLPF